MTPNPIKCEYGNYVLKDIFCKFYTDCLTEPAKLDCAMSCEICPLANKLEKFYIERRY